MIRRHVLVLKLKTMFNANAFFFSEMSVNCGCGGGLCELLQVNITKLSTVECADVIYNFVQRYLR